MSITQIDRDHFDGGKNLTPSPVDADRDLAVLIRELQASINDALDTISDYTANAASWTKGLFVAPEAGEISHFSIYFGTAAAAGESMEVDLQIGGVSCLVAPITVDDTDGTDVVSGTIDTAANTLAAGDKVEIVFTYTAGGAPTPMAQMLSTVSAKYQ